MLCLFIFIDHDIFYDIRIQDHAWKSPTTITVILFIKINYYIMWVSYICFIKLNE